MLLPLAPLALGLALQQRPDSAPATAPPLVIAGGTVVDLSRQGSSTADVRDAVVVVLALLVRVGLTPRQALAAATSNFGELAPWRTLGRVAPGTEADVLLLDADPTADIANAKRIRAVILRGRPLDRAALLAGK